MKFVVIALLAMVLGGNPLANAALVDRGGGLIYDSDLNITWYDSSIGAVKWNQATSWAGDLSVTVNGITYDDWRLPQTLPVNGGTYNYNTSNSGSTDIGYNISAPGSTYPGSKGSEMAYLFYVELANNGFLDLGGNHPQSGWGLVNKGPFTNLSPSGYWSGTKYPPNPIFAWCFDFYAGSQVYDFTNTANYFVLAVHEGDIAAPVPIPGAIWLLGTGLVGLVGVRRKIGKK